MSHHLTLYSAGRHGCWATCSCRAWSSGLWTTVVGAHLAFGRHLIGVKP